MPRSTLAKDVESFPRFGVGEATHVFNDTENGNLCFFEHGNGFAGIQQGNFLGSANNYRSRQWEQLRERQRHIASSWGHIDNQVVQFAPVRIFEKLGDRTMKHRSSPNDGLIASDQKTHRHDRHGSAWNRLNFVVENLRASFQAEHVRDAGSINIGVEQADFGAKGLQCEGYRCG